LWRSRKWRRLLNLIDHLPTNSHFRQAQLNDPKWAAEIVKAQEAAKQRDEAAPSGIRVSEFSREVAGMRDAVVELRGLRALIEGVFSGKPSKPMPYDAVITALEKARNAQRWKRHQELAAKVLPHKRKG